MFSMSSIRPWATTVATCKQRLPSPAAAEERVVRVKTAGLHGAATVERATHEWLGTKRVDA